MTTTGERIQQAREAHGLKRAQLADAVGCSRSSITLWETGRRMPLPGQLGRIAGVLHTTKESLQGSDYRVSPRHVTHTPIMEALAMAPVTALHTGGPINESEYIRVKDVVEILSRFGTGINPSRIHELVQSHGLPAYQNPLRRNREGEPTLLFRRSEVVAWIQAQLQPVNTVPR